MMKTGAFKIFSSLLILSIFCLIIIPAYLVYSAETPSADAIRIPLVYPQESNAPKKQPKKIEKPSILKGEVFIDVAGIDREQIDNPNLYVEYFLDDALIYTTEGRSKSTPFGFILDTCLYSDGEHNLVANLWDTDGPSAIGIKKVIIQNQDED